MYPFFHQSWSLFAPPPNINYHLYAQYDGIKTHDIFEEILVRHQTNRLRGYGPFLIAFVNSIHYFEKGTKLRAAVNGPIKDDLYFKILEHAARNYLSHTVKEQLQTVKLKLVIDDLPDKTSRIYYN